jgi:hypothetical protein
VLFTDNHALHIQEHSAIASDPQIRSDPQLFQVVANHIMEHLQILSNPAYQNYLSLTGQQPMQPAGAPSMGGQPPGAMPMAQPGAPMSGQDIQGMASNVKPPQAPANALTSERNPLPTSQAAA